MDTIKKLPERSTLLWLGCFIWVICQLTGCMYGNAAMTSAQAVYDRHSLQQKMNEHYTTVKAYQAIYLNTDQFKNTNVAISIFNDAILITGRTPDEEQKSAIGEVITRLAGPRTVYNFTEIGSPLSVLTEASDGWITTKIKAKFIVINEIEPSKIRVITENSTVYLMGIVSPDQADIAVEVAEATSGVQKVVKIFSYLRITKT